MTRQERGVHVPATVTGQVEQSRLQDAAERCRNDDIGPQSADFLQGIHGMQPERLQNGQACAPGRDDGRRFAKPETPSGTLIRPADKPDHLMAAPEKDLEEIRRELRRSEEEDAHAGYFGTICVTALRATSTLTSSAIRRTTTSSFRPRIWP